MEFLIIPLKELKEFDKDWEYRRKSNDGIKAIIHKEIYDELMPQPMILNLTDEPQEVVYPYPLVSGDEINNLDDFKPKEPII